MTLHDVRYRFEHRILPGMFFEHQEGFVGMLLDDKTKLYQICNSVFEYAEMENPYSEEDFDVEAMKIDDDTYMLKIIFPEPETEPLCYCSYLFFKVDFTKTAYYCLEKGNSYSSDLPFLCAWTEDGTHHNFGNCELDDKKAFVRCLEIFLGGKYKKEV